jgi:universal stress protein A
MLHPKKLLVPTDFSKYADSALKQALDIAQDYGAKIYLLHVVPGELRRMADDYTDIPITEEAVQQFEEKMVASVRRKLERQIDKMRGERTIEVIQETRVGRPDEEIVKFQREKHVDLVVISSLGKAGLSGYLIGRVARAVLRGATCSVLLSK